MLLNEIKWGIIGCGDVTEVKSGPAFSKIPHSSVVAVMRRNAGLAEDYARRHHVARWYSEVDLILKDPEVNAIYVATPPNTHSLYTLLALQSGKPVYVEKPMARNHEECFEMVSYSEKSGIPLFVAYYRRMLPGFLKVKELIDNKTIGDIRFVNIRLIKRIKDIDKDTKQLPWRLDPNVSGGGYFFDLASHQLDYLDYIFGPVTKVQSMVKNQAGIYFAEDFLAVNLEFENGVVGNGIWCFNLESGAEEDVIEIMGSKGKIELSTFNFSPVILTLHEGTFEYRFDKPLHVQQELIQTVVDELRGEGKCPSTGVTGARTNRIMDLIVKEYYNR
jgi:predicted dehydrogenase